MELFQIDKILVEEVSNVKFLMEEKVSRRDTDCYLGILLYRVTIQVVSNLPLTTKQKFRFNRRSLY